MKDLLNKKHIDFLYKMKFYDDLDVAKQKVKYTIRKIRDFNRTKQDQGGFKLQLLCNKDK
jgi:hypothetical protein